MKKVVMKMLAEERFREILKIVNQKKTVTVTELTELLDTSESTIRRDLTQLHKRGALVKVHGGAMTADLEYTTKDAKVSEREALYVEEKRRIGMYAASLICPEDFVYIDAGTSTAALAEAVTRQEAVYVTNGIQHAKCLSEKGCRVFLPGGELKENTQALVGGAAVEWLNKYNFTKGFFGTNGIHPEKGYTTPDISEALVKEAVIKRCKETYILADSSKFGHVSSVTFAQFEDARIITDHIEDPVFRTYRNIKEV